MPLVAGGYARFADVGDGRERDESVARSGYVAQSGRAPRSVDPYRTWNGVLWRAWYHQGWRRRAGALPSVIGRASMKHVFCIRRSKLSFWEWLRVSTDFVRSLPRSLVTHWYFVVTHTLQESRKPRCPRCGKRLTTDKAQQCFGCGLCWHGSPRPDARSDKFANWPHEKYESFFREVIRELGAASSSWISRSWNLCVWRVVSGRWREAEAWAAAGVGVDDIRALKQLIKSHRFRDPIIGIKRTTENKLQIDVGWLAGPLTGAGTTLVVRRGENGWRIEAQSGWIS